MRSVLTPVIVATALIAACGGDDDGDAAGDAPEVVVTTTILGDIVRAVVGDAAEVEVVMPLGADPHDFAASTRQAEAMAEADLLVVNGAGFEASLDGAIDTAEDSGSELFVVADHVDLLPADDDEHEHDGSEHDPHLWTDPSRLVPAVEALAGALAEIDGIGPGVDERAAAYAEELEALDAEIEATLAAIPAERRVLVTNHEVLRYFADRYGFEVVGAVIPSLTTGAGASAADLEALADTIRAAGVPAIFGETTSSTQLADALADEVGEVQVVSLFTESLGEPGSGAETYVDMMRTNARLVQEALS
jgi:zinc/manganese transport system substrate-binding protein